MQNRPDLIRNPTAIVNTASPPTTESQLLAREVRQTIFQKIQALTGRTLICYVSSYEISDEDARYLEKLLYAEDQGTHLDLMLHSPGGDIHTAEKLVRMLWSTSSSDPENSPPGKFRLIVPDRAKSAATLVALGAEKIVMSTTSELGPIDPQVSLQDQSGNWMWQSAFDYIEAYKTAEDNYRKKSDDPAHRAVFESLDSVRLLSMNKLIEYTRMCAEDLLKSHGANYSLAPSILMDRKRFPSHEQMIDWETARRDLKLRVIFVNQRDELWRLYWGLYGHLQSAVAGHRKIFESAQVSLIVA